jgi:hypothetical protein
VLTPSRHDLKKKDHVRVKNGVHDERNMNPEEVSDRQREEEDRNNE